MSAQRGGWCDTTISELSVTGVANIAGYWNTIRRILNEDAQLFFTTEGRLFLLRHRCILLIIATPAS